MKDTLTLTIPAHTSHLPVVRAYVGEVARTMGFTDENVDGIVLAAAEAAANVMVHAFLPEEEANFEVVCQVSPIALRVIVRDKGLPFAPDKVEKFSIDRVLRGKQPRGLGFFLMERNVDKLSFHNLGFNGKEVHLVKYLHQKHIQDILSQHDLEAYREAAVSRRPARRPKKIPYRISLMRPSQGLEVSQCAYRTYGYHYVHENIYYPERIVEMNRKGSLISAVAVRNRPREVMGHAALELGDERGLAELGMAFTKPHFRQQGCFNRLAQYLIRKAEKKNIGALYARAVTTHPYSQKAILKNGFKDCGILIGLAPATLFQKLPEGGKQRESIVILFRNIGLGDVRSLYAPPAHRDVLARMYAHIGMSARWKRADKVRWAHRRKTAKKQQRNRQQPVIETKVNTVLNVAAIHVKHYGDGVQQEIQNSLNGLCQRRIEAINLYLDLRDPATADMTEAFERMGFFFAGILPSLTRQNLILQYLNNVSVDYGKIAAVSDFSKELLGYIKSRDPGQGAA